MNDRIVKELLKARSDVRKKYQSLQADIAESELELEKHYKPIAQPLKEFMSTIKGDPAALVKIEPRYEESILSQEKSHSKLLSPVTTPSRAKTYGRRSAPFPSLEEEEYILDTTEDTPKTPSYDITSRISKTPISTPVMREYLGQYHGLARSYVEAMLKDNRGEFDHQYGVRFNPDEDKFYIGNSELDFDGEDIIIRNITTNTSKKYKGTDGLYQLLFMKNSAGYTDADNATYGDIVKKTNANRRNYDSHQQVIGNAGVKYKTVVQHLFPSSRKGHGIESLKVTSKRVEYIPWQDPNKLVERLRLLMSSQMAGHTGHENEITYIIDALRKSKYIQ